MLVATLLLAPGMLTGQPVGGRAGAALRAPELPQEIGLGGMLLPFDPDGTAVLVNSASLARLQRPSAGLAWSSATFGVIGSTAIGIGAPLTSSVSLGLGLTSQSTSEQTGYDAARRSIGTIVDRQLGLAFGGSLAIGPGSVGATLRLLRRDITGVGLSNTGYSLDLSGTMAFEERLFLGLSLHDIAGEVLAGESTLRETLPWEARLSAAYVYPLAESQVFSRLDPSGAMVSLPQVPTAYVLAAVGARAIAGEPAQTWSFAAEAVPLVSLPLGFRASVNSIGEVSGGFFYRLPIEFARALRLDYTVRWYEPPTDVTHHVGLTATF